MADKLRKAACNGTRLTLDPAQVQLLMSPRIYKSIAFLELEELTAPCRQDTKPAVVNAPLASSLVPSGSGIVPTATHGRSVGSTVEQRAADALVSQAARLLRRPKMQKTL
ncbi:MAG: hypothetical protein H7255_11185 [Ramlibacter sp.]|nr:hypothetical protein [Ramlibacter sp.]